jgi:hypothetical protein
MCGYRRRAGYGVNISIVGQREYFAMVMLIYDSSMSAAVLTSSLQGEMGRAKNPAMKRKILAIIAGLLKLLVVKGNCCANN